LISQLPDDRLALELYERSRIDPESEVAAELLRAARSQKLRNAIAAELARRQQAARAYAAELALVEAAENAVLQVDAMALEELTGRWRELPEHNEELKNRFLAARYRMLRAQEELLAAQKTVERNRKLAVDMLHQLQELSGSGNWKAINQIIEAWQRYNLEKSADPECVALFQALAADLMTQYDRIRALNAQLLEKAAAVLQTFRNYLAQPGVPPAEERQKLLKELEDTAAASEGIYPDRFQELREEIYNCEREMRRRARLEAQKRDFERWEHYTLKMDICAELEKLANVPDRALPEAARIFRKNRERWNSIGPVPNEKFEELRVRYHEACSALHARLEQFFSERDALQSQARNTKEVLLQEAETLAESDDRNATSTRLKELQNLWKSAGSAGAAVDRELFKRFHAACDSFFVRRNAVWEEQKKQYMAAAKRKRELCAAAEALINLPFNQAKNEIAALREAWRNTPSAGKDDRLLYIEFNRTIENIFAAHREAGDEARRQSEIVCTGLMEVLEKARSGAYTIRDVERMQQDNQHSWENLGFRPAADVTRRRERIAEELQTVLCGMLHQEAMHKLESAGQLESVIDTGADEAKLIDHLGRRLKVCAELEERLRECRVIAGGGDLASELQSAFNGNFGNGAFQLSIAELDEFLQRFVAVGQVPPDAREAVFERFRSLYNRALTFLQNNEIKSGVGPDPE